MLKTILIVEPNPYHGVVLPGLTFYFQKLGYNVTVLWRIECKNELPFCYFKRKPTLLYRNIEGIRSFLRSKASEEFDYIFFASNALWEPGYFQNGFIKYLDFIPKGKKGTFYIEHNLNHITEDANSFFLKTGRVFTLFPFKTNTGVTKMINTTYFGDFPLKAESKLPHFIVVGNINQKTKNFKLLIDTAQQLLKYKYKFRITIVGNGLLRVPTKLKKYIYVVGKLNYPKMYTLLRKADFFLPMLDSSIPEHSRYISQTTTGSLLLILGFAKVPLIEDVFANFYGLNETNSILYKNGSFFSSMIEAIKLTPKKYIHKQQNLNKYTLKLRKLSVQNIRSQILICSKRPRILVLFEDHYQLFLARLDFLLQRLSSFFYTLSVRISSKFKK